MEELKVNQRLNKDLNLLYLVNINKENHEIELGASKA